MQRFGSDKPDTRFGLEMQPLPELLSSSPNFSDDEGTAAVVAATALVLRCEAKWAPGDTKKLHKLLAAHGPGAGADGGTASAGAKLGVIKIQVRLYNVHDQRASLWLRFVFNFVVARAIQRYR